MQKQCTSDVTYVLGRFFNNAKSANRRKETVEIAEIAEHKKQNDQRNTKIIISQISFKGSSPEALVEWLLCVILMIKTYER